MGRNELLELQRGLISYLADPRYFGQCETAAPLPGTLAGVNLSRLELVGLLAQGKRISKVMRILPRTFYYLNPDLKAAPGEFASRHPPLSAEAYVNACQFYAFLRHLWRLRPPVPPFLPDLAYCELAMASVVRRGPAIAESVLADTSLPRRLRIRRRPGTHFRRCEYNIQPLFENAQQDAKVVHQPTCVIVACPLNADGVTAVAVDEQMFSLVVNLKPWCALTPSDALFESATVRLLRRLEELGILEVQVCESA